MDFDISKYIRDVADFPKEGIMFKDITPILNDPLALSMTTKKLVALAKELKIDKVAAMESRGFMFGTLIANQLGVGFVPVRKAGKLPYDTLKQEYTLEYGVDSLEIHTDAIQKGEKVLIHDDVLATGGTAEATIRLIEQAGGEVVQLSFLMELSFLNGKEKLNGYDVQSLVIY